MPLTKLQFKPGVVKDTTAYSNEGGWVDSDKVRFRFGFPEKIGGWESRTSDTIVGTPRALHAWETLDAQSLVGIGTHRKYYIESSGNIFNVTPPRLGVLVPQDVTGVSTGTTSVGTVTVDDQAIGLSGNSASGSIGDVTVTIA